MTGDILLSDKERGQIEAFTQANYSIRELGKEYVIECHNIILDCYSSKLTIHLILLFWFFSKLN